MALEDLARLIAPKRPKNALKILRCFYGVEGGRGRTMRELMQETGMKEKTIRYYITCLKRWRILLTQRNYMKPATYHLDHRGFHARIDSLLCDPLKNLINFGLWQANEPITPRFASAEVGGLRHG